jgi:hypothetical protein
MSIDVVAEEEINVGEPAVIEGPAPKGPYVAVFEDDGETGYFYALDTRLEETPIQDAVQIYNVANITDRHKPSLVTIGWSEDHQKAVLLINEHPHAVFDFSAKQGFCRTGYPPPNSKGVWSTSGHSWSDMAIKLFA